MRVRSLWLVLSLPLLVASCQTAGLDMPLGFRIAAEIYLGAGKLMATVLPSEVRAPEGMVAERVYDFGDTTAVGLTVDGRGDVYVAQSGRVRVGTSDNRFKPYWLIDDLAAQHVDDRRAYIEKWAERGRDPLSWYTRTSDAVVRLRDADGDRRFERVDELATFNDVLTGIGASVLVDDARGQVWFTDIPDLVRLEDADDDGRAEIVDRVAHGFGVTTSLGGHDLHGLIWGPDGRIYFSLGDRGYNVETEDGRRLRPPMVVSRGAVFRVWPDGSGLEVFATGLRNPQDLAFDDYGNLFTADNNGDGVDEARLVYVTEGSDSGWAMPVQTMDDAAYYHGPWEAERLWEVDHEGRPAWVLPPIGYVARGPSGIAIDPGLGGLPEEHRGQILVCDYQYARSRSAIRAYAYEPKGAGFVRTTESDVIGNLLPTDLAFAPDGRIFVTEFDQFGGGSSLVELAPVEGSEDPRSAELAALLREGFTERSDSELAELLGHEDRRARRGAQFELAARRAYDALGRLAFDEQAPVLARVHALWGLGQLGATGVRRAGIVDLGWTHRAHPEVRAAALSLAGEARAEWLRDELRAALSADAAPRHRAIAARSLARIGEAGDVAALGEVLASNADRDPFLRQAAVFGLDRLLGRHGSAARRELVALAESPDASVRLGALLAFRLHEDPVLARFLEDAELRLVVEAARAIYDLQISEAMPALAAVHLSKWPRSEGDSQTTGALHRRVLAANLALGGSERALAIARYASDDGNPDALREVALDALSTFATPPLREPVFGFYRPQPERPSEQLHAALDSLVPALVGTNYEARALEIAVEAGRVPLDDDALVSRVKGWFTSEDLKLASLGVLRERRSPRLAEAVESALRSRSPALRSAARDALSDSDPEAAVASVLALGERAPAVERQRGYATLARLGGEAADARLLSDLEVLAAGELAPEVELDLLEAAERRAAASAPIAETLSARQAGTEGSGPVASRSAALHGGDAMRGKAVFEGAGDCVRCHAVRDEGHGGRAGPSLENVARRHDRRGLLESVVEPQAEVAAGFGTVAVTLRDGSSQVGTLTHEDSESLTIEAGGDSLRIPRSEIESATQPSSNMPPMGLALSMRDLRDLIEYLDTL